MKGEIFFEKMTNISDEYIQEAALLPRAGRPRRVRPENAFTRFMDSGWGVAMLCAVVSLIAVVALAKWGQTELPAGFSDRFEFSYEITYDDGRAWDGHPAPGDTVTVTTSITNLGEAFGTYGFSARAHFVLQDDSSVLLEGFYPAIDPAWHTVEHGQQGYLTTHIFIPEDAVSGVYDLVLFYNGVEAVYRGVMTVGEPEEITPLDRFSFGYEPAQGVATPDSIFEMTAWVVNDGDAFTFVGDPYDFTPTAVLYHQDSVYTVLGDRAPTGIPARPCTVAHGQMGKISYSFYFPADAPIGSYRLVLSYGEEKQTFEDVLTVTQIPLSDESVLHAWTGPYSEEKHITAIETYAESYSPVDYGTSLPVDSVVFDAGFEVADCRVERTGAYGFTGQEELANAVEKNIPCHADGRNIHVDTSWWYSDKESYAVWAYLVCATDTSGVDHYFYCRVRYSEYTPDVQDHILFAWEGEKTDEKLLSAIVEYAANYTPIDYGAYIPVDRVVINTDYAIESCKQMNTSLLDYENHEREAATFAELYDFGVKVTTDHQIIVNTSEYVDEWSHSSAYSYLIQVTGTDGKQRYYYFRVDHEPFAGPFDLSYVPPVDASQHILEAWTGEYTTEKHAAAIEEYEAHYTPIEYGPDVPVTSLCFELDFTPSDVSSYRICRADGMETNPGHIYLLGLLYQIQGNRIYLNTNSLSDSSGLKSLLYGIKDTEGVVHYYYFRIDSSVYQPPTESET